MLNGCVLNGLLAALICEAVVIEDDLQRSTFADAWRENNEDSTRIDARSVQLAVRSILAPGGGYDVAAAAATSAGSSRFRFRENPSEASTIEEAIKAAYDKHPRPNSIKDELMRHAVAEGTKAVTKYVAALSQTRGASAPGVPPSAPGVPPSAPGVPPSVLLALIAIALGVFFFVFRSGEL